MTFKRPRRVGQAAAVELTPLIDVVFLLLIFFMASTTFLREAHLAVELPQAAAQGPPTAGGLDVRVDAFGQYAVNGRRLPDDQLVTLLDALGGPPRQVVVAADARAPHAAVVRVLDAAGRSGLTDIRIAILPTSDATGPADG